MRVSPPLELNEQHRLAIGKYFADERTLSLHEWRLVLQAMNLLRRGEVERADRTESFADLYERHVDAAYADAFLELLLMMDDPATQSEPLRAAAARDIARRLTEERLHDPGISETQLLVVFCLYWWQSFTKSYAFEVEMFRDLDASGVAYEAHDLRRREERLAPQDLIVLGRRGDVKTSTYFLQVGSVTALPHDFYLTRLYDPSARQWRRVVLLRHDFWRTLNGDPTPSALSEVWQVLPGAALVELGGGPFVVAPYEMWKDLVLRHQQGGPT